MATIYIPSEYINNCNVVHNGYIRSYLDNTYTSYVDIFPKQDYMVQAGTLSVPDSPICDTLNAYSTDIWYRCDITLILINVLIIAIFGIYFPYRIFSRLFGRWLKL